MGLLEHLRDLFFPSNDAARATQPRIPPQVRTDLDAVHAPLHPVRDVEADAIVHAHTPRYPAYDHGFPASVPAALLELHGALLNRLDQIATFDGDRSRNAIKQIVANYASYVNCLPASFRENHYGAGGMLKVGLDVAFYSLQASAATIFSNESADRRTLSAPRWKLAVFIAGIASELSRTVSHLLVTNEKGQQWHPFIEPLTEWLARTSSPRFWVVWLTPDEIANQKALVTFILPHIIPKDVVNYIAEDRRILILMNAAIASAHLPANENPIYSIVEKIRYKVIKADIESNPEFLARPQIGSHLEPHIIDAMRALVEIGVWEPNQKGSRLWMTVEGAFLVWKTASVELMERLRRNNTPGLPQSTDTIYDILLSAGVIEPSEEEDSLWSITINDGKHTLKAIKLARPELLVQDLAVVIAGANFQLLGVAASADVDAAPELASGGGDRGGDGADDASRRHPASRAGEPEPDDVPAKGKRARAGRQARKASDADRTGMPEATAAPPAQALRPTVAPRTGSRSHVVDEADVAAHVGALPPAIKNVFEVLRELHATASVECIEQGPACLIPLNLFIEHGEGIEKLSLIASLAKNQMLYVPPGQSKKIISLVDTDGVMTDCVGIYKPYAKKLLGID